MLNKHGETCCWSAHWSAFPCCCCGSAARPPASPLTLLLVLMTTLTGFALLLFLTHSVRRGEKARQEQRWLLALQQRDPAMLDSVQAQTALRQLLASFNEAEIDAHRQITEFVQSGDPGRDDGPWRNRHAFRRDLTELLQQETPRPPSWCSSAPPSSGPSTPSAGFPVRDAYIRDIAALISHRQPLPGPPGLSHLGADFAVLLPPLAQIPPHLLGRI